MSEARATGLNFYVINKSFAQVTTNPPDGSVTSAKMASGQLQILELVRLQLQRLFTGGVDATNTIL